MTTLYFAPHQDDELIVLGVDLCRSTRAQADSTHVYLCTDGSASGVRKSLCNGACDCTLHQEPHYFQLSVGEFIAARDREYWLSCAAMGVPEENIHISPLRQRDQGLTFDAAEQIILDALAQVPAGESISVRTLSPCYAHRKQQDDHRNLGLAAQKLFQEGKFQELVLILEYEAMADCGKYFPQVDFTKIQADPDDLEKLTAAAAAYRRWDPEAGFYAVGYHSVQGEFVALLQDPRTMVHGPLETT